MNRCIVLYPVCPVVPISADVRAACILRPRFRAAAGDGAPRSADGSDPGVPAVPAISATLIPNDASPRLAASWLTVVLPRLDVP